VRIPYYHVDAFAPKRFRGNPAGVCPLEKWLPVETLHEIAAENNLSETAFFVRENDEYRLRWFTPTIEVDLCGHATLASAHVLFSELGYSEKTVRFQTLSGPVSAARRNGRIELDFPSWPPALCDPPEILLRALRTPPQEVRKSRDYLLLYDSQSAIAALNPDMDLLSKLDCVGTIVTAPGEDSDFVSRFFAPGAGVPEDPVTGSAHSSLIPFWAERLGKAEMFARQISRRGGELFCRFLGQRVGIAGQAITYSRAELEI
jgi:predicted PhzF superfamily epimerase YddE/YHI9